MGQWPGGGPWVWCQRVAGGGRCVVGPPPRVSPHGLAALPLSPQARPWWLWSPATGRPRGAAPAPPATTGARTVTAAAATPSARPAWVPNARVRGCFPHGPALAKPFSPTEARACPEEASLRPPRPGEPGGAQGAWGAPGDGAQVRF